jgi:hypothetical protein
MNGAVPTVQETDRQSHFHIIEDSPESEKIRATKSIYIK